MPSLRALLDSPRHEVVGRGDPARRAERAAAAALRRSPVGALADAAGVPVLTPDRPRDPDFLAALRDLAPDCCPVVAYGALVPRGRAGRARATAGSTCTSPCCPPGAGPRRCRPRSATATRSPAPPPSGSRRASTPARCSAWSPRPCGADDTAGDAPAPARRLGSHAAAGHARRHRRRQPQPAPAARGRRLARPEGDRGRRARRLGRATHRRSTGSSARSPPTRARWTTFRDERLGVGPLRPAAGRLPDVEARRAARREAARARRHRRARRSRSARCGRWASAPCPRPTGPAGCASSPASCSR